MDNLDPYYKTCLEHELAKRCEKNPNYSLRAFAKACRLSPGELSMILSGKRVPSYKMAQKILGGLDLAPGEVQKFFSSLAQTQNGRGLKNLSRAFRKIPAESAPKEINIDLFRVIGDWYHYAILMMTYIEGFKYQPKWIASQLGISEIETKLAIDRLINVGLVREEDGSLVGTNDHITTSDKHLTTPALKRHTRQSLEKAIYSLENDPIEERSHTYMTMAINPEKMDEAKKLIDDFTNKMSSYLESSRRTQVYEFGVYLYPLTKKEK